jgi:hypothetical protein
LPLETATYIQDLITSNPAASDGINNADDHMRLIKAVLKNSFPGVSSPWSRAQGLIVPSGAAATPSYSFTDEPTLGLYRSASGLITIVGGRLSGNGAVPVGSLHEFLVEPEGFKNDGSAGGQYLELNGQTYNTADYPRLATHLGISTSTFALINVTDTGRFPRSRRTGVTAGTKESGLVGAHGHTATADTQGSHAHNVSGSTGFMDRNDPHAHAIAEADRLAVAGFNDTHIANGSGLYGRAPFSIAPTSVNHAHGVGGATDAQGAHSHNITVAANVGAETRPEAYSVIKCIKT